MLILGIVYGAKVGLKLRLKVCAQDSNFSWNIDNESIIGLGYYGL